MEIQAKRFSLEDKINEAIEWLQEKDKETKEGFTIAFSGGKDSSVAYALAREAGVRIKKVCFILTGVDPPQLIEFIKTYYPEVEFVRPKKLMDEIIAARTSPPTAKYRYCCQFLKTLKGDLIAGMRKAESRRRSKYQRVFQHRRWKSVKFYLPILEWSDRDVWDYIKLRGLPYCWLYDAGFCRIGCIGCPLKSLKQREMDFLIWPQYKTYYINAFDKMLKNGKRSYTWKTGEEVFDWWMHKADEKKKEEKEKL